MSVLKVYHELDPELEDRIRRASIQLPVNAFLSQPRPGNSQQSVVFNVGKGQSLRKLIFGFTPKGRGPVATLDGASDTVISIFAADPNAATAMNRLFSPLAYHPMFPLVMM